MIVGCSMLVAEQGDRQLKANTWHALQVHVSGQAISVTCDGRAVFSDIEAKSGTPLAGGPSHALRVHTKIHIYIYIYIYIYTHTIYIYTVSICIHTYSYAHRGFIRVYACCMKI